MLRFDPFRDLDFATDRPAAYEAFRRNDEVIVRFDVPGVDADHLELTVEKNTMTLNVERSAAHAEGDKVLAGRLPHGKATRVLTLGDNLDTDNLSASLTNGVLEVRMPMAEKAKPRRIEVASDGRQAIETTEVNSVHEAA